MWRASFLGFFGSALIVTTCLGLGCSSRADETKSIATGKSQGALARTFDRVAHEQGVPQALLVAIAHVEGGLGLAPTREIELDNHVPAAGPLQLRHGKLDTLALGATLMGTTEEALRRDRDLALEAGARVLAELFRRTGAVADDARTWTAALEELSGFADAFHRRDYARRVLRAYADGGALPAHGGETITIVARPFDVDIWAPGNVDVPLKGEADYAPADWFPTDCSGKCDAGRGGNTVGYIVIHDTEGGWDASVATLQNDAGKSVQYIVGEDGRVGQFVHETVTAWHAGNYWYNQRSIGIEHVGTTKGPFPEAEYAASAKLVSYLTGKYPVPKDRVHIIGHDQVPNGTKIAQSAAACSDSPKDCEASPNYGGSGRHTDPGTWEWCQYMPRFGGACKCNDIWALWNCTSDHTKAYRCTGGKVELLVCDGPGACESKPIGTEDICHVAPAGDAGGVDAGRDAGSGADAHEDVGTDTAVSDAASDTPASADAGVDDAGEAGPASQEDMSGGCSIARAGERDDEPIFGFGIAVGLGLGLARSRKRRAGRASSRSDVGPAVPR